jgi:hypothetical protein
MSSCFATKAPSGPDLADLTLSSLMKGYVDGGRHYRGRVIDIAKMG